MKETTLQPKSEPAPESGVGQSRPRCNLCGSQNFVDMNGRANVRCSVCNSLERTRVMQLFFDRLSLQRPGLRVMHLAPEAGLTRRFVDAGAVYEAYDLQPDLYPHCEVRRFDLADCEMLPSRHYDVIVHSHVVEHVACNVTAVFYHLHRALKDDGAHVFSVPIYAGTYREDLGRLPDAERVKLFHQDNHMRRFGRQDLLKTIGMIFRLPAEYNLAALFEPDELRAANIPEAAWHGYNASSVFCLKKSDLKLVDT